MSPENATPDSKLAERIALRTERRRKDFEHLLAEAEKLQSLVDSLHARRLLMNALVIAGLVFCTTLGVMIPFYLDQSTVVTSLVGSIVALLTGVSTLSYSSIGLLAPRYRRDRRALHDVAEILRETERAVAKRYNLSPIERAFFKIRISRLDIGEPNGSMTDAPAVK